MLDIFDFNGDGKTSFEEELFGTMLVMGTFDEKEQDPLDLCDCLDDCDDDANEF